MSAAIARPFLKWAGGKTQLLSQFDCFYPIELKTNQITRYVEPFLGGGAVFLDIAQRFHLEDAYLSDINPELILVYQVVKQQPDALIGLLSEYEQKYMSLEQDARSELFYTIRSEYNEQRKQIDYKRFSEEWVTRAARMIFLNKTCFNGLFRVNSKGEFNVPFGKYKKPKICDFSNLLKVSELLQNATIKTGPFTKWTNIINDETFVYFDPPYRPISTTSSFTSYAKGGFDDSQQEALATYAVKIATETSAKIMLSNSDPTSLDPLDTFFEELYSSFCIHRVQANRMINSQAHKRGKIAELLITNYQPNNHD